MGYYGFFNKESIHSIQDLIQYPFGKNESKREHS